MLTLIQQLNTERRETSLPRWTIMNCSVIFVNRPFLQTFSSSAPVHEGSSASRSLSIEARVSLSRQSTRVIEVTLTQCDWNIGKEKNISPVTSYPLVAILSYCSPLFLFQYSSSLNDLTASDNVNTLSLVTQHYNSSPLCLARVTLHVLSLLSFLRKSMQTLLSEIHVCKDDHKLVAMLHLTSILMYVKCQLNFLAQSNFLYFPLPFHSLHSAWRVKYLNVQTLFSLFLSPFNQLIRLIHIFRQLFWVQENLPAHMNQCEWYAQSSKSQQDTRTKQIDFATYLSPLVSHHSLPCSFFLLPCLTASTVASIQSPRWTNNQKQITFVLECVFTRADCVNLLKTYECNLKWKRERIRISSGKWCSITCSGQRCNDHSSLDDWLMTSFSIPSTGTHR